MAPDWSAYEMVLADLRAQRDKLGTAIEAIEALRPADEVVGPPKPASMMSAIPSLSGRFSGMTIVDASLEVLKEAHSPVRVADITDRIIAGGVGISGDAPNTVGSILNRRMREKGDVRRIGRGTWAMESYMMELGGQPRSQDLPENPASGDAAQAGEGRVPQARSSDPDIGWGRS